MDPQVQSLATLGRADSAHDVCKVNFLCSWKGESICAAQPTDELRVLPRPCGQWESPVARIVEVREPRHAIAGGAWDEIGEGHIAPDFLVENCKTMIGAHLPGTEPKPAVRWFLASSLLPERFLNPCGGMGWPVIATMELQEALVVEFQLHKGDLQRDGVPKRGPHKDP